MRSLLFSRLIASGMPSRARRIGVSFSLLIGVFVCAQLPYPVYARSEVEVAFVALGDMPYGPDETAGVRYRQLIHAINQADSEFSIHVGDIKSGSSLCSDEEFLRQRRHFDQFVRPVIGAAMARTIRSSASPSFECCSSLSRHPWVRREFH
jgi:hypothetical protein